MKRLAIILLAAILFGCFGQQQAVKLTLSDISYAPNDVYAGDVVEAGVGITATGDTNVSVEAYLNGNLVKSETVSLSKGVESRATFDVVPALGANTIKIAVDPANVVEGSDPGKQKVASITAQPALKPVPFSEIPGENLTAVELLNATQDAAAVLQLLQLAQPSMINSSYLSVFESVQPAGLKEMEVGYFAYASGSQGALVSLRGISKSDAALMAESVFDFGGAAPVNKTETVNGKQLLVLSAAPPYEYKFGSVCIWDETGWVAALVYIPHPNESRFCSDILGTYDPAGAEALLAKADDLKANVSKNGTIYMEGYNVLAGNDTAQYQAAYYDNAGDYIVYTSRQPYNGGQDMCGGEKITRGSKKVCIELVQNNSIILAKRNVGDYGISVFANPLNATTEEYVLNKSLEIALLPNFPGVERDWATQQLKPAACAFSSDLSCESYNLSRGVLTLALRPTTGNHAINGITCTNEAKLNTTKMMLPQPVSLAANETKQFHVQCYDELGNNRTGEYVYLDTKVYVNLTVSNNETVLISGNLTINEET